MRLLDCENCKIDRLILRLKARGLGVAEIAAHPSVRLHRSKVYKRLAKMREAYEVISARPE